jgi:hypothetical protein
MTSLLCFVSSAAGTAKKEITTFDVEMHISSVPGPLKKSENKIKSRIAKKMKEREPERSKPRSTDWSDAKVSFVSKASPENWRKGRDPGWMGIVTD